MKTLCEANDKKIAGLNESLRAARTEATELAVDVGALQSSLVDKDASLAQKDRLLQEHLAARVFAEREAGTLVGQRQWLLSTGVPQVCIVAFCLSVYLLYFTLSKYASSVAQLVENITCGAQFQELLGQMIAAAKMAGRQQGFA